jgi:hypothetical protein
LQGGVAIGTAVVLVVRGLLGRDPGGGSAYGSAAWFAILGAAVVAGGVALVFGKRWGRAIAVVAQVLLLPVVWTMLTDSHQPVLGALLGVVVLATLALLFSPQASKWMAAEYGEADSEP